MDAMSTYMDTCGFHRPFNTLNTVKNRIKNGTATARGGGCRGEPAAECRHIASAAADAIGEERATTAFLTPIQPDNSKRGTL